MGLWIVLPAIVLVIWGIAETAMTVRRADEICDEVAELEQELAAIKAQRKAAKRGR